MHPSPSFICRQCRVGLRTFTNAQFAVARQTVSSLEIEGTKNLGTKRYGVFVVLWVVAILGISAFATVTVNVPTSGSTVASPVQFVASGNHLNVFQGSRLGRGLH